MSPQFPSSRPRTPPPGAINFRQTLPFPDEKASHPRGWARWQKALLCSSIWLVIIVSAAIIHTSVILAGKLSQAEDAALSERYGIICGAGIVVFLAAIFSRRTSRD